MGSTLLLLILIFCNNYLLNSQTEIIAKKSDQQQTKLMNFSGKISISMSGLNLTAQFSAAMVGEDSASLSIYGPMGVILGKIFANKNYFAIYDVMNNWAVVGNPTRDNIFKASQVPLSFTDFVRLFHGEIPVDSDSLRKQSEQSNPEKTLYYRVNKEFVDFYLLSNITGKLVQYQKKSLDGRVVLNLIISEYMEFEGELFPKKYLMHVSDRNGNLTMEIEEIRSESNFSKPFSFAIPKSVEIFPYFETQTRQK